MPSAPTTRSYVRGAPFSNVTCTPSAVSVSDVIESPKTYAQSSLVRSYSSSREVAATDLHVPAGELAGDDRQRPAGGVDDGLVGAAGLPAPHLVEKAHPGQHGVVGRTLEVDRLTAGAHDPATSRRP